jgi:hypothetical protein
MSDAQFIRVKDKRTKHQYDTHVSKVNPEIHEVLDRFEPAIRPRAVKPFVSRKSSAPKAVEGVSPESAAS